MSVIEGEDWVANTTKDPRAKEVDGSLVKLMNAANMKGAVEVIANYLVGCAEDQYLQEFANRALTNVGFDLEIIKGVHFTSAEKRKDTSAVFKELHFDMRAARSERSPNPGTSGIIYHITVATGMVIKKNTGFFITGISYRESGTDHETKLNLIGSFK